MNSIDIPSTEGDRCLAQSDDCYLVKFPFTMHSVFTDSKGTEGFSIGFLYLFVLGEITIS